MPSSLAPCHGPARTRWGDGQIFWQTRGISPTGINPSGIGIHWDLHRPPGDPV